MISDFFVFPFAIREIVSLKSGKFLVSEYIQFTPNSTIEFLDNN